MLLLDPGNAEYLKNIVCLNCTGDTYDWSSPRIYRDYVQLCYKMAFKVCAAEYYMTLHKIVFRVPKITRTARTLYEIKGLMWWYTYVGKHLEKR